MRRLVSVLLFLTLVLSLLPATLLAQDAPDQDTGAPDRASGPHVYLPVVNGSVQIPTVVAAPEPTPPAQDADWPGDLGWGNQKHGKVTPAERLAAAQRAAALGEQPATVTGATGEIAAAAMSSSPHFFGPFPNYANSPLPTVSAGGITGGIRKFVDDLPGLGPDHKNNLGQYIPVAVPDTTTYPGSDYYEVAVVEYQEKLHTDLPPTKLRGYVQLATAVVPGSQVPLTTTTGSPILLPNGSQAIGVDGPHYLGPLIIATKDKPVRILFRNLLPTGQGGNLFIPVDVSEMGSGMGPAMGGMMEMDPQNPMCGMIPKPMGCYTENRATIHLHGGLTPWISDGTAHQWITPAGEDTAYPKGVSVQNVPDMPDPGPGAMTFFYTNQQSARLLFYHDHSWGITRLNVYAGEAAGYLITDDAEKKLIADQVIPADQIPLIIQDKTFVPPMEQRMLEDPLWDAARWGDTGSLWVPHVYMPAQNPGDSSGVNQYGRWAYGPWFWPPTADITYGPKANPYYDIACDPDAKWCEPPLIPAVPNLSMGMEAFNDTPLVNGTAYPVLTVDPKTYRFRILNAADDRFFNLSLYKVDPISDTEVTLDPALVEAALTDPTIFPTPINGNEGPNWIQIGTEGGFLPTPAVISPQYITWVTDPTVFNAGNVDKHSLLLGPAERADVIVDFSAYAGQTLMLYNDAPAAFPARDSRYDYYTGNADLRSTGGAPTTLPGYGPNTRTVMQIKVNNVTPASAFDLAKLDAAFAHKADGSGVFESSQAPIVVGQEPYNSAYGTTFPANGPLAGLVRIFETSFTFLTLNGTRLTMPMQPKTIQDEMGEAYEKEYGRMSGNLGVEAPNPTAATQSMILYPYINPATEVVSAINVPFGVKLTPIATTTDGTQIWKITHNGVDTHPIHFHLFDIQLINRVGWDGIIRTPDENELGWKDTVRVSPLEDTIVALRPLLPKAPFGVPDSIRPLNPMMPIGDATGFNNVDTNGDPITPGITNELVNFGWEYMWHCHILSHEEMDMMRPIILSVLNLVPGKPNPVSASSVSPAPDSVAVQLNWTDPTPPALLANWGNLANEIGFKIERATGNGPFKLIATALANQVSYLDPTVGANSVYRYRVTAYNAVGSGVSDAVTVSTGASLKPAAPTGLGATIQFGNQVRLNWNSSNLATGYIVTRTGGSVPFTPVPLNGSNNTRYTDSANIVLGTTYTYNVVAVNGSVNPAVNSDPATTSIQVPFPAPTNFSVGTRTTNSLSLSWRAGQNGQPQRYEIWTSTNGTTWAPLTGAGALNATSFTVNGLITRTTYWYEIRAYTTSTPPVYSVWTAPISGTTR
jgi:FtsP/CotA-like multicopper oxidase with cupredoxin domain/fibronectin type 3 domain-containing protein